MEGKRLLEYIKDLKEVPKLPKAIRNYLNPLFQSTHPKDDEKYSTFALKATKACIKSLSFGKHTQTLLEVAMTCMEAVKNREREASLNTERLLVVLVSQCVKIGEVDKSLRCCVILTERLYEEQQEDAVMLLKNTADLIWSLAAQVEQRHDMPEKVLQLRQQSLVTLLTAKPDLGLFTSRAIKTDNMFRKVKREAVPALVSLHNTLLSHEFVKKSFSASLVCDDLGNIHMWLLQAAKSKLSRFDNASSLLQKHLRSCRHKHLCELFLQELSWLLLHIPSLPPSTESEWVSKLIKCSSLLSSVNRELTAVQLPRIVEAVDHFTTALRTARKRWKEEETGSFLLASVFSPLKQLSTSYVKWMDKFMKTQLATLSKAGKKESEGEGVICKIASCQLSCLSLANDALLDSLLDKRDEIELPRNKPLTTSRPHPKALLADECLPLIKQSHTILSSAPSSVRILEHRWVGTDAYNLGVTLHDEGLTEQAVGLLELACKDLALWCKHKGGTAHVEVKLIKKYCLLSDCYQTLHRYDDAMVTIANAFTSLPTGQNEYRTLLVSQFVRVKSSMVKSGHADSGIMKRTIIDIATEQSTFTDHMKAVILEEELRQYKQHSKKQHLPEAHLAVANALLPLYSSQPNHQHDHARILIELATLYSRVHSDVSNSLRYVEQAIEILQTDEVVCNSECVRLDQLATAYLWKATFVHESKVRSCEGVDVLSDGDLPKALTQAMMSEEVEECLQTAITCWEECVKKMDNHSLVPMKVLPSLLSSCHSLQLALLLSSSLHLTALSSKAASCLIAITSACSEVETIHQWALSRQAWLCEEASDLAYSGLCDIVAKKVGTGNVMLMHCHLALAYTSLLRGEMERCRQLIIGVLNDPALSQRLQSSYAITAQAAMIISSYLQRQVPSVLPWKQYLDHLQSTASSSTTDSNSFKLTELELLLEALKLLRSLAHSNATITSSSQQDTCKSMEDEDSVCLDDAVMEEEKETDCVAVSYSLFSWEVMERLLQCLLEVGTLCVRQGAVRDGIHYYKEGLMLAQRTCLKYRCVEFMVLISDARRLSGETSAAQSLLLKASELLQLKSYLMSFLPHSDSSDEDLLVEEMSQLALSSPPLPSSLRKHQFLTISILHSCAQQLLSQYPSKASSILEHTSTLLKSSLFPSLSIQNAHLKAELLLSQQQPSQAMAVCKCAVVGFKSQRVVDPSLRMQYAQLHFTYGRAVLMDLILSRPHLSSCIWEGVGGTGGDYTEDDEEDEVIVPKRAPRSTRRLNLNSDDDEAESRAKGRGRGKGKGKRTKPKPEPKQKTTLATSSSLPHSLYPVLSNLLTSHQLCHPSCFFLLLREVSQLLTVCLASWDHLTASHFLLHSSHLTLTHQTILNLGRKIRNALTVSLQSLILSSLTNDSTSIADSTQLSHTLQARNTLLLSTPCTPNLTCTQRLIDSLPSEWTFCQVVLVRHLADSNLRCLVIVRVRSGRQPVMVRIPVKLPEKDMIDTLLSSNLLAQFDILMSASLDSMKLTNKREWWSSRKRLNAELKELLDNLQITWFGPWRLLLQGTTEESSDSLAALLHRRSCTPVSDVWTEILANTVDMSREEVTTVLGAVCKKAVPDKVITEVMKLLSTFQSSPRGPLLLCLGPQLQSLPLESQPCLIKQPTSRVPSLLFLSSLITLQTPSNFSSSISIDTSRTFYVLNPKGDLINTEKMFKVWFDTERGWKGVVSREPTANEISLALKDHHMFIYCGHGSGREFLPSNRLQQLTCLAAVIQMGCSSGKLSVNGSLDPNGYAMNYLIAGCPCIVGNLWDVTDQDIDRYCKTLLKSWLHQDPPGTLLQSTACTSREICTLPYLIGASPVVYGLPTSRHL